MCAWRAATRYILDCRSVRAPSVCTLQHARRELLRSVHTEDRLTTRAAHQRTKPSKAADGGPVDIQKNVIADIARRSGLPTALAHIRERSQHSPLQVGASVVFGMYAALVDHALAAAGATGGPRPAKTVDRDVNALITLREAFKDLQARRQVMDAERIAGYLRTLAASGGQEGVHSAGDEALRVFKCDDRNVLERSQLINDVVVSLCKGAPHERQGTSCKPAGDVTGQRSSDGVRVAAQLITKYTMQVNLDALHCALDALFRRDDIAAADTLLQQWLKLRPEEPPNVHTCRKFLSGWLGRGDYEAALQALNLVHRSAAVSLDKGDTEEAYEPVSQELAKAAAMAMRTGTETEGEEHGTAAGGDALDPPDFGSALDALDTSLWRDQATVCSFVTYALCSVQLTRTAAEVYLQHFAPRMLHLGDAVLDRLIRQLAEEHAAAEGHDLAARQMVHIALLHLRRRRSVPLYSAAVAAKVALAKAPPKWQDVSAALRQEASQLLLLAQRRAVQLVREKRLEDDELQALLEGFVALAPHNSATVRPFLYKLRAAGVRFPHRALPTLLQLCGTLNDEVLMTRTLRKDGGSWENDGTIVEAVVGALLSMGQVSRALATLKRCKKGVEHRSAWVGRRLTTVEKLKKSGAHGELTTVALLSPYVAEQEHDIILKFLIRSQRSRPDEIRRVLSKYRHKHSASIVDAAMIGYLRDRDYPNAGRLFKILNQEITFKRGTMESLLTLALKWDALSDAVKYMDYICKTHTSISPSCIDLILQRLAAEGDMDGLCKLYMLTTPRNNSRARLQRILFGMKQSGAFLRMVPQFAQRCGELIDERREDGAKAGLDRDPNTTAAADSVVRSAMLHEEYRRIWKELEGAQEDAWEVSAAEVGGFDSVMSEALEDMLTVDGPESAKPAPRVDATVVQTVTPHPITRAWPWLSQALQRQRQLSSAAGSEQRPILKKSS